MKIFKKSSLRGKINKFNIVIFDLDNTIYDEKEFDVPSLKNVSKYLEKKININNEIIFKKLKSLRFKKKKLIFNRFLQNIKLSKTNYKYLVQKTVKIFQEYECNELKNIDSLKQDLRIYCKTKKLYLVTNGQKSRQKKKITKLGIKKFFKKIYILDGKQNSLKPSIKSVSSLKKIIKKEGPRNVVFVGDNNIIDKKFAKNLKITFVNFVFRNSKIFRV